MARFKLVAVLAVAALMNGCAVWTLADAWVDLEPRCPGRWVVTCEAGELEHGEDERATWTRLDGERVRGRWLGRKAREALVSEARAAGLVCQGEPSAVRFEDGHVALLPRSACRHEGSTPAPAVLLRDRPWPAATADAPLGWRRYTARVEPESRVAGDALLVVGRGLLVPLFVPAAVLDVVNPVNWLLLGIVLDG